MKILITGGAGFIGCNVAAHYLHSNAEVAVFDNLSRAYTPENLEWLRSCGGNLIFINGDIRNPAKVNLLTRFLKQADGVLHLAAQVAVTTSVSDPRRDFEINALGTLNLLEAIRASGSRAKFIYSSTNKVYGSMEDVLLHETDTRYEYVNLKNGVSEDRALDFHSPYGCSKGAADQYVHDYSRIYGLDTVVMRQSCIYGPRQFGVEDQGWVAWFIIAVLQGRPLTIYGDGKQVRDLLYIDDLIYAYDLVIKAREKTRGGIYNIGGGTANTLSVWSEFGPILEKLTGRKIQVTYKDTRAGDQKIFIADIRKAKREFGWEPSVKIADGLAKTYSWILSNRDSLRSKT